jgi:hypothetical protein
MSRTIKKVNEDPMSQKITPKNARKIIKLHDKAAKFADMSYYNVQSRNYALGRELEDWLDTEFHF